MQIDETLKQVTKEYARIREDWIKHSIRCNINEGYVILDFQQFVKENNIQLVFNPITEYTELLMNKEVIGKFHERPEIVEEEGTFRFVTKYWTRNSK